MAAAFTSSSLTRRARLAFVLTILLPVAFSFQLHTQLQRPPFSPAFIVPSAVTLSNGYRKSAHVLRRKRGKGDDEFDDGEDFEDEDEEK